MQKRNASFKAYSLLKAATEKDVLDIREGQRLIHPASVVQASLDAVEQQCRLQAAQIKPQHAALANRLKHWHASHTWTDAPFMPPAALFSAQVMPQVLKVIGCCHAYAAESCW